MTPPRFRVLGHPGEVRTTTNGGAPDQDTAELVRRAAAGDELAWRQLKNGLGPLLRRASSAYLLGEAEAADVVATVWSKLAENIGSLRDGSSVPGWLMATLRTECLARESARSRQRPVADFAGGAQIDELRRAIDESEQRRQAAEVKLADCERRLGTARQTIAAQDRRIRWLMAEFARLRNAAASTGPLTTFATPRDFQRVQQRRRRLMPVQRHKPRSAEVAATQIR
jgi:DNA-directed RNA polymerase specialized sigma24 family protein